MLTGLSVRNIVLIDQLDLGFEGGLSVLTGETGAGKSILLDALTLALGGRGDAALVRAGAGSGQVVAVLQLPAGHAVRVMLRDNDIADDEELILRRVQFADGKTRAFINDQPVSAAMLARIGTLTAEIHGQHDGRALVDPATHRALLDAFGGLGDAVAAGVNAAHAALLGAQRDLAEQQAAVAEAARRDDYARHVVDELGKLAPQPGEEEQLAERRSQMQQLERAADEVTEVDAVLNGPAAAGPALAQLMRRLGRKADAGAEIFRPLVDTLDAALLAMDGVQSALDGIPARHGVRSGRARKCRGAPVRAARRRAQAWSQRRRPRRRAAKLQRRHCHARKW